jgi:uncharacterized RDD family membrane protein YckC
MKNYATFSQRFIAMWIDFLVFVPLMLAYQGVASVSKVAAVVFTILHVCLGQAYSIYGHGRFGKTVGKLVMGIRVVRVTGEPLRWREAWLRSAFDLCFVFVSTIGQVAAMIAIANSEYYGVGWSTRSANLAAHEPTWATWAMKLGTIWVFSEASEGGLCMTSLRERWLCRSDGRAPPNKPLQRAIPPQGHWCNINEPLVRRARR